MLLIGLRTVMSPKASLGFCKIVTLLGGISDFEKMKDF